MHIELGERSYDVLVSVLLFDEAWPQYPGAKGEVALLTDSNVKEQEWFAGLRECVQQNAKKLLELEVCAGETSKSFGEFSRLCSEMARAGMSRSCTVLAVGGGVVGDLGGYLAASYLRGVAFVQVPTTLLAMVDSSVGGKTGINLPEGKNLVGAFYQPGLVLADLMYLYTLPQREFCAGMAEVLKYGLIRDSKLWEELKSEDRVEEEFFNEVTLNTVIRRCVRIKADIVAEDEREVSGARALLNFGHTIGHAIEQVAGYGEYLHGEAISVGMVAAARLSQKVCGLPAESVDEIRSELARWNLPVEAKGLDRAAIWNAISRDKKNSAQGLKWVLLDRIGNAVIRTDVSRESVDEVLDEFLS